MFRWQPSLDDDEVYEMVKALEFGGNFHTKDTAVGKSLWSMAERLRTDYASHLRQLAETVRDGKDSWKRLDAVPVVVPGEH